MYEDAAKDFAAVHEAAVSVIAEALQRWPVPPSLPGASVFNPSSYDRREVVEAEPGRLELVAAPACGWAPLQPVSSDGVVEIGEGWMDNGLLRVQWDTDGLLTSVWDHEADREVLADGRRGNLFQLHEDYPRHFDAWDVERQYFDHVTDLVAADAVEITERDPLRAAIRITRSFEQSRSPDHAAGRWVPPVGVPHRGRLAAPASLPQGGIPGSSALHPGDLRDPARSHRAAHRRNTSWDVARFEVCGHRWADLSETGYGVALLNDCKYGYDIRGDVLRLSLLRGPGYPDPDADRGVDRFAYALLPHAGDLAEVIREAEWFNLPLTVMAGGGPGGQVVSVGSAGRQHRGSQVGDRSEGVVLRLCEVPGSRGRVGHAPPTVRGGASHRPARTGRVSVGS